MGVGVVGVVGGAEGDGDGVGVGVGETGLIAGDGGAVCWPTQAESVITSAIRAAMGVVFFKAFTFS